MKTINDFKGTKGDFNISEAFLRIEIVNELGHLAGECRFPPDAPVNYVKEFQANAKLFAASKDLLLSVSRFALLNEEVYPEMKGWILEARKTIEKAL